MKKTIRRSVQRRKVAFIASRDRKYTVNNCTIKKAELPKGYVIYKDGSGEWEHKVSSVKTFTTRKESMANNILARRS